MDLKYGIDMERVLIQPSCLWQLHGALSMCFHAGDWGPGHLRGEGTNAEFNSRLSFLSAVHFWDLNVWFQIKLFLPVEDTVMISGCIAVTKALRKVCMNRWREKKVERTFGHTSPSFTLKATNFKLNYYRRSCFGNNVLLPGELQTYMALV